MNDEVTQLNARARGWLRHLWEKATTPDDWSSSGEPHPWWDRDSSGPMCAFPRFDLGESAYALPLMCEVTPAWREVYTRIARELCERHMTFWAAIDALVLIGEDPNVDRYPPEWQIYMPERLRGAYAPPGWIGNGDERWGLNPDPIAADGNVFFRGFFNLMLSVYAYVSGETRYHEPFQVSGYMDRTFTWTQPELAGFISAQLAEQHYMGRDRRGYLEWFAFYYEPIERQACSFPDHVTALAALVTLPYIYPQRPDWGGWLDEQAVRKLGWSNPQARINQFIPDPRTTSIALLMAHELGDDVTEQRMRDYVEEHCQPRFFGDENDRFGFFFGFDEPYPRGQHSALLPPPSWESLSAAAPVITATSSVASQKHARPFLIQAYRNAIAHDLLRTEGPSSGRRRARAHRVRGDARAHCAWPGALPRCKWSIRAPLRGTGRSRGGGTGGARLGCSRASRCDRLR